MNNGVRISLSVADSTGTLLFYGDYEQIWTRNNQLMPNGTGLLGGSAIGQAILAIPKLGEDSCYYIFTVGNGSANPPYYGLYYSVLDMRLNGGLGDIRPFAKNIPIFTANDACVHVTSIRHHNNQDIWVVVTKESSYQNAFASYLVTASGISPTPVLSPGLLLTLGGGGQMKISPDGSKLVVCHNYSAEVCNFNSSTGAVTPLFKFVPQQGTPFPNKFPQGVEFSINSKYLYISNHDYNPDTIGGSLYQYDARITDSLQFMQSEYLVGYGAYLYLQMGPDGKIYVPPHDYSGPGMTNISPYLHVIENPSVYGNGCGYHKKAVYLGGGGRYASGSVPQFLQKYYAYIHHGGQCQGSPVLFTCEVWPQMDSVWWDFGDPGSGQSNFSNRVSPSHIYSLPGNYTVSFIVRHIDMRYDTVIRQIEILPAYIPFLGDDKIICIGDLVTFDAGSCFGCSYLWKDATTGLPVGNSQTYTTTQAGTYLVMVTSPNGCAVTDTVQLVTTPVPQVTNTQLTKSICSGENTNIALTSDVPGATFLWTCTLTSGTVTGFSADSGLMINQTLVNSGPTPGIVIYHITPRVGSCSGNLVNFQVTVNPGENVNITIAASANNVCTGTPVTFTATPTNPGSLPVYQWKVNGVDAGSNNLVFTYTPVNGDVVSCILTSSNTICTANNPATSNTITMTVTQPLPVSVSVSATSNPVCTGTAVTFTAAPNNEGLTPAYQWKVNGGNVGTGLPTYTYTPASGDLVSCILTSSLTCVTGNPATATPITMIVNSQLPVGVTITVTTNPVCDGTPVTFSANPTNPGGSPIYQWKLNDADAGINSQFYTMTPANNDQVKCILTSSMSCVTGNPATSLPILMNVAPTPAVTFTTCFDTITTINAKPIKLKGGLPYGGTYSGPGVNSTTGIFTPSAAGVGTHIITYSYANSLLCSASKQLSIINYPLSIINCGSPLTDIRDNKVYPTVQIGTQCWMQANLDFGSTINELIQQTDNCIVEKYTPNSPLLTPNSFYQWDEVMRYDPTPGLQGLCPPGWHVPDETEWNTLFNFYQGNARAGYPLQDQFLNSFKAQQSGVYYLNSMWTFTDFATLFWSSTMADQTRAYAHGMNTIDQSVSVYAGLKANAFSVRCLKD